ncbi:cell wall hydrolase/autolysin [Cyanobacterium stanieri PCC 7202]|uniref:Cell wall hydrolase/autolysin n=1 Tax=Cyanobacterium stanieri (strain ATCC 29140 / PCC 7202) TaxID=292563 RepID=K9YJT4_CYASC|nr:cell wall hydrolase/autolysin [Cyanobacterium stanieri PCC 7202]
MVKKTYLCAFFLLTALLTIAPYHLNNKIKPVQAQNNPLKIVYPPDNHQTVAPSIFLIGSAPENATVSVNGATIDTSSQGFFAPSFPLEMGANTFVVRSQNQTITKTITRTSNQPSQEDLRSLAPNLLYPSVDIARLPDELVCFEAIAPKNAQVSVKLSQNTIPLNPTDTTVNLPPNYAVLTANNKPETIPSPHWATMKGCQKLTTVGNIETPIFTMDYQGQTITQNQVGTIETLAPQNLRVIEVTASQGVARTGPSTNHSRLTPLPQGTQAQVTGIEGEWLRLDYGAWIRENETRTLSIQAPPISNIRSVNSRTTANGTEIIFPLQNPVPITIQQADDTFTFSLHNTIAQTDTIRFDDNPLIRRLDWHQVTPTQIDYIFRLKTPQQWGFDVRYQGNNLILTLNHPPTVQSTENLRGVTILLDPGHGGDELGAVGPNGYTEKEINLVMSKLIAQRLRSRGAEVILTREDDSFVSLGDRMAMIDQTKPTLALSIHYNALPDAGDAINTKGVGMFWYHPQAHDLAIFLQDYLTTNLNRPSYGVFWNNLALTRPHTAPSLLLELGFMINPEEFEWIINPQAQQELADGVTNGVAQWLVSKTN